jgi:ubiquitin thioesterase protein OTUB1
VTNTDGYLAIGFSYVETLQKLGDKKLLEAECDRMLGLTDWVESMTGHEAWIFDDMRDGVINLLREVINQLHHGPITEEKSVLLASFNDPGESDGMVYWCRLLASAYLKANPGAFQDFIPDLIGVDNYCKDVLEPSNNEIEHLGMTLLFEVLLKPIGVAVEIVYLDRSVGTEANVHYLKPDVPNSARSTIYLLYRPGHYDILYKDANPTRTQSLSQQQISDSAAAHSNIQVNRATSFTHRHSIQGTPADYHGVDMSILVNMPTLFGPLQTSPGYAESYHSVADFSPPPTHVPSYVDSSRTTHSISPASSVSPGPTIFPASTLPMHPNTMAANVSPTAASQFRPSMYQYREDWGDAPAQGFQTSTFKNSHYNVSHYNNPNFQPEQWTPDCDEAVGKLTRRGTS